jgi:DNA-binding NarL/FixJ family response regulator
LTLLRILIADDNEFVRRGVAALLSAEPDWEICGEAPDGAEALQKARALQPNVILLDISMPGINGLEVARHLRRELPEAKIVVMSQHDPGHLRPRVIDAGGDACLDKGLLGIELIATIKSLTSPARPLEPGH